MATQQLDDAMLTLPEAQADSAAIRAFGGVAAQFDERFDAWRSVAAQRAAVRDYLLRVFPPRSHVLELGGGTGTDAIFLARNGRRVLLTDGAPEMVCIATRKIHALGLDSQVSVRRLAIESLDTLTVAEPALDGAYSNFAAFNCVLDLAPAASALARVLAPAAPLVLVVFGRYCVGEWLLHLARGDARTAFRRWTRGALSTRISGNEFSIRYWGIREIVRAFAPHFRLRAIRGVGIAVPPSAAEPGISRYPRLLRAMQAFDRVASRPLALLGDHVLVHLERRDAGLA